MFFYINSSNINCKINQRNVINWLFYELMISLYECGHSYNGTSREQLGDMGTISSYNNIKAQGDTGPMLKDNRVFFIKVRVIFIHCLKTYKYWRS